MQIATFKPSGITIETIRNLIINKKHDELVLYCAYVEISEWQGTHIVKATTGFMAKRLGWGEKRVQSAKKQLKEYGIIRDITRKKNGVVAGHYIEVMFIVSQGVSQEKLDKNEGLDTTPAHSPGVVDHQGWSTDGTSAFNKRESAFNKNKQIKDLSKDKKDEPFNWPAYLKQLLNSDRVEFRMIAYFMGRKGMKPQSKAEVSAIIRRYSTKVDGESFGYPKLIGVFPPSKVKKAYDDIEKDPELKEKYTMETVYKYLTK